MAAPDLRSRLLAALEVSGAASSEFDLNPDEAPQDRREFAPAAALVGVIPAPAGARLILTKRSSSLKHHPGQIAFPGGKVDVGDASAADAALREAHEEIGLEPSRADVLGELPIHETVSGFAVAPVLALIDRGFVPIPEPEEVDEAFDVPLDHVIDPARFSIQSRRWRGRRRRYYAVPYGPYYIWGATARILRGLAERMAS